MPEDKCVYELPEFDRDGFDANKHNRYIVRRKAVADKQRFKMKTKFRALEVK